MKKLLAVWALVALAWPCLAGAVTVNIASDGTMWIEKPVFNPFVIFWLLSVAAVVFGVLRMRENKDVTFAIVFAIVAIVFAIVATFAIVAILALVPLVAILALVPLASDDKKMFYILAGIYGVLMAVIMVAFLLG